MNVEAIDSENGLKVMEMNARIPTQAPSAVLAATGINLLREMTLPVSGRRHKAKETKASSYEHFLIKGDTLRTCGEREFSEITKPRLVRGLFGADEMITDFEEGADSWRCAMINSAASDAELEKKRTSCIRTLMDECRIRTFTDS